MSAMAQVCVALDPEVRCADAVDFEQRLRRKVIGQDDAVSIATVAIQKFMAGLHAPGRPIGNVLLLGPTGTGKTRLVEAIAEVITGDENRFVKVDCGEFQQSHETAKLIGSPPGYLGHKETKPVITQERIDKCYTKDSKIAIVLFDEIEKANPSFWDLLLGIMDKAKLTLGTGEIVDLSKCLIFMTSNLGSKEVGDALSGGLGFSVASLSEDRTNQQIHKVSQDAARRKFSPEFFNRLDHIVTFKALTHDELRKVLRIEIGQVQKRILSSENDQKFVFDCSKEVEDFLIKEGTDQRYGARHLKRVLEKRIVEPMASLIMSGQVGLGDLVRVTYINGKIRFEKIPGDVIAQLPEAEWADYRSPFQD
jgi:ATP-dependent Clp protease ATP-binding subunit ClpB